MACFLLHNFIRTEMAIDPIEEVIDNLGDANEVDHDDYEDYVDAVESTTAWNQKRDELAQFMWQNA